MGLLNLPGPVFAWLDGVLGFLPPLARILVWGVIAGLASMGLYAWLAPQERIARGKRAALEARRALDAHDGALVDAGPLIGRMLKLSLGQVRLTSMPALIASVPLLALLVWMSTAYGLRLPGPGESASLETQPPAASAEWVMPDQSGGAPGIAVRNAQGAEVARVSLNAPVNVLHQWQWWNLILGNPAGYLPSGSGVERVQLELPEAQYLGFGPQWARGWEVPFFTALILASVALKFGARIE